MLEQAFAVIEVVAEGGADLGFGFERGDELAFDNDQEIPAFARAEVAGQFKGALIIDMRAVDARFDGEFGEEFDETVHLCAAGDGTAKALVGDTGCSLLLRLAGSRSPVMAYRVARVFGKLGKDGWRRHCEASVVPEIPGGQREVGRNAGMRRGAFHA